MSYFKKIILFLISVFFLFPVWVAPDLYAEEKEAENSGDTVESGASSKMPAYYPSFKSAKKSLASGKEKESTESEENDKEEIKGEYDQENFSLLLENEETLFLEDYFDDTDLDFLFDLLQDEDIVSVVFTAEDQSEIEKLSNYDPALSLRLWDFDLSSKQAVYFYTEGVLTGLPDYVLQAQGGWFRWADANSLDLEHSDQILHTGLHDKADRQYADHFLSQKYFYTDSGEYERIEFYTSCGGRGYELNTFGNIVSGRYTYRIDLFDPGLKDADNLFFNDPYPYNWDPEISGYLVCDDFGRYFLCADDGSTWLIISRAEGLEDGAEFLNSLDLEHLAAEKARLCLTGHEYDNDYIYLDAKQTRVLAVTGGEVLQPVPAEDNLYQNGQAELIGPELETADLTVRDNGNIQDLELIVDHENPQDQAVSWQWQRLNEQDLSWSLDFSGLDLSGQDLSSLIVRAVVSGTSGSDFSISFFDAQEETVSLKVSDHFALSENLQYLALPLDLFTEQNPDFNWSEIKSLACTAVSAEGRVNIQQMTVSDISRQTEQGIAVGVFQDNDFTPVPEWQGIEPAYVLSYKTFFDILEDDLSSRMSDLTDRGQIPYLTLECWPLADNLQASDSEREAFISAYGSEVYEQIISDVDALSILQSINNGVYDCIFRDYASAAAAVDSPVLLRIFHEFNGHWYPWTVEQSDESEFISAWNRVYDIFRQQGADNALFVYSPFILNEKGYDRVERILAAIKDTVSIIALDGYGPSPDNPQGLSFNELFSECMLRLEKFNIPFMIGEFASESDKENFYSSCDALLRSGAFPQLLAITYFDIEKYERGAWRYFSVDTISRTVQSYQADGFYRVSPDRFLESIASFQSFSHYYWGDGLENTDLSAEVYFSDLEISKTVTVTVADSVLRLSADTDQAGEEYVLDLVSGLIVHGVNELDFLSAEEDYQAAVREMISLVSALAGVLITGEEQSRLKKIEAYLSAVDYRILHPDASAVVMPELPEKVSTGPDRRVIIEFESGTLLPEQFSRFWAEVQYGENVEYWDITPQALSSDGKSISLQFSSQFDAMTVAMRFYGMDQEGKQTRFTDPVLVFVDAGTSTISMPQLPAEAVTSANGTAEIDFLFGSLFSAQLNDLWAEVSYEGKTEYWDLHPSMLFSDGSGFSIQFSSEFDGKILNLRLYGFDRENKQTEFSNEVVLKVISSASQAVMPLLPEKIETEAGITTKIVFTGGHLFASQLNDLWAEVSYEGKTEYWDLHPAMLSSDGFSFEIVFDPVFRGKTLNLRLYGFDTEGRQTLFTNLIQITVN